jgi:hypothetical protein
MPKSTAMRGDFSRVSMRTLSCDGHDLLGHFRGHIRDDDDSRWRLTGFGYMGKHRLRRKRFKHARLHCAYQHEPRIVSSTCGGQF